MNKLIVFSATWCGPCKAMKPVVDQLDQSRVERYDIDQSRDKLEQYKVSAVPTFIAVDEAGTEINRIMGATTLSKLQELLA